MDTRKVTLVATIAVIALVAVGIGYAYTAMTTNSGNTSYSEYVTLTQSGTGAYTFINDPATGNIYFDTNTVAAGTTYTLMNGKTTDQKAQAISDIKNSDESSIFGVQLGSDAKIHAVPTGTNAPVSGYYDVRITSSGADVSSEFFALILFYYSNESDKTTDNNIQYAICEDGITWKYFSYAGVAQSAINLVKNTNAQDSKEYIMKLYYATKTQDGSIRAVAPFERPLNETSFTFSYAVSSQDTYKVTFSGSNFKVYNEPSNTPIESGVTKIAKNSVIRVVPDAGYAITSVTLSPAGPTISNDGEYRFNMPANNVTMTVVVAPVLTYTGAHFTAHLASYDGAVIKSGNGVAGASTVYLVPDDGYMISEVTGVDTTDDGNNKKFVMAATPLEITVTTVAAWVLNYAIAPGDGATIHLNTANGTEIISGSLVAVGDTVYIVPAAGRQINDVLGVDTTDDGNNKKFEMPENLVGLSVSTSSTS